MTTLFNSITVCETEEDFDAIKEELQFPCVVVIGDNNENIREMGIDMVFGPKLEK